MTESDTVMGICCEDCLKSQFYHSFIRPLGHRVLDDGSVIAVWKCDRGHYPKMGGVNIPIKPFEEIKTFTNWKCQTDGLVWRKAGLLSPSWADLQGHVKHRILLVSREHIPTGRFIHRHDKFGWHRVGVQHKDPIIAKIKRL